MDTSTEVRIPVECRSLTGKDRIRSGHTWPATTYRKAEVDPNGLKALAEDLSIDVRRLDGVGLTRPEKPKQAAVDPIYAARLEVEAAYARKLAAAKADFEKVQLELTKNLGDFHAKAEQAMRERDAAFRQLDVARKTISDLKESHATEMAHVRRNSEDALAKRDAKLKELECEIHNLKNPEEKPDRRRK